MNTKERDMNISELLPNVYYSGVDDRTTYRFEGLWELPFGVTYNSYMVRGDKTALIDTVEIHKLEEYFRNLEKIGAKPDYLVVNHMEPDHSGAIPALLDHCPDLKIVGNAQTVKMIKGFYHVMEDERFLTVKDGDKLDLGQGLVLQFFLTPMVHWPETMVTYMESRKLLFSGDAFGTFGALDGAILDTQIANPCMYFEEMHRYYAAIVAKYGAAVQKALAKLGGLKLSYLCSTHGPVWHELAKDVIEAYDSMSSGKTEPGVVIAYGSMYGNTEMLVDTLARALRSEGVKKIQVFNLTHAAQSRVLAQIWRYKGLVLASPTYNANLFPPVESLLKALEVRNLSDRTVGLIGSYTWAAASLRIMEQRTEALGLNVVARANMCMSPDSNTEEEIYAMAKAIAANL